MRLLLRWLLAALTLLLATQIIAGVHVDTFYAALVAALFIGLLNAVIRPVLVLLTLPVNIVTLGLFTFVINAVLVWFASTIVKGFTIESFLPALMTALMLWAVGTLSNWFLYQDKTA